MISFQRFYFFASSLYPSVCLGLHYLNSIHFFFMRKTSTDIYDLAVLFFFIWQNLITREESENVRRNNYSIIFSVFLFLKSQIPPPTAGVKKTRSSTDRRTAFGPPRPRWRRRGRACCWPPHGNCTRCSSSGRSECKTGRPSRRPGGAEEMMTVDPPGMRVKLNRKFTFVCQWI